MEDPPAITLITTFGSLLSSLQPSHPSSLPPLWCKFPRYRGHRTIAMAVAPLSPLQLGFDGPGDFWQHHGDIRCCSSVALVSGEGKTVVDRKCLYFTWWPAASSAFTGILQGFFLVCCRFSTSFFFVVLARESYIYCAVCTRRAASENAGRIFIPGTPG